MQELEDLGEGPRAQAQEPDLLGCRVRWCLGKGCPEGVEGRRYHLCGGRVRVERQD